MTLHELLEAAQLDALGLLDPEEQEAFERAFTAAAPSVREQVRREQARLCRLEHILPDVQPENLLRDRVLRAVDAAARGESADQPAQESELVRRLRHEAGRTSPELNPRRRVSALWRAAAIGFAAAAVLLGVTTVQMRSEYDQLAVAIENDALMMELTKQLGRDYVTSLLFEANTRRLTFSAVAPEFEGRAALFVNADWAQARLFCQNLPAQPGRVYRLVALDDQSRVIREFAEFESQGGVMGQSTTIDSSGAYRLALVSTERGRPASDGVVLLATQPLALALG